MKKIILIFGILLLSIVLVLANEEHQAEIEEGKKLVESKISCDNLTNEQLEAIGDYYMEEMHPGKAHELMHDMMGGHDSELTKNMHINMAKSIYCRETNQSMNNMMGMMNMMQGGMMSSEGGMMSSGGMMGQGMIGNGMGNMMGSGMMNNQQQTNMMQSKMGNLWYTSDYGYLNLSNILYITLLIGLIILVYLWIMKLWKDFYGKKK